MKVYKTISFFFGMLLFSSIVQGQTIYKKYMRPTSSFQIDTVFNITRNEFTGSNQTNRLWLNTLNSQYVDTTKNKINAAAIPAYIPIKKNALTNPYSIPNQIIGALVPYGYYFPNTQNGSTTYYPVNKVYRTIPYGSSPYNVHAPGSPYYMLPKF